MVKSPPLTQADVAQLFEEVANLLEIQGADGFRVNSYRRIARTVSELTRDLHEIAAEGGLAQLPGIGKSSAEKIAELLRTGRLSLREELAAVVPPTLLELLRIPTVGPKKVALLWKERGITKLAELKAALAAGALAGLKGFGDKSIAQIAHGIEFLEGSAGRVRLGDAWGLAERLRAEVAHLPGVDRVEWAGSLRRGRETVGDLDLLCVAEDGAAVVAAFVELPGAVETLAAGDTKGSARFELRGGQVQVDLRVVSARSFGAAWQYFTGSKEHNVRLRELAVRRGWSLNEYGLTKGERVIASETEEEIYAALGLPWIPPELREDRGELAAEGVPAHLLRVEDIRGDLHLHTTASDGRNTITEMIMAAQTRGYEYLCITDHSRSSVIANGLSAERLRAHIADVRAAARSAQGIRVWIGSEVDILADGKLDYPDELLAELDFVVASVHAGMGQDAAANTRRVLGAIHNPYVHCIGHLTGRLIHEREAMPLDVEAICRAAAATGTALEINASYLRLDLKDQHARRAHELGVTIAINTDAHEVGQYDQMRYGVTTARRAGLERGDVLNTRPAADIMAFVSAKRKHGPARD